MKKGLFLLSLIVTFYALGTVSASAVTNDTVKVGLRYGSSVMSSANLENDEGSGYEFGYFEDDRTFVSLGETDETAITMEPAGRDGIQVTITGTDRVLYESREDTLAVMPQGRDPVTWFRGNRYRGGFEYTVSGGGLQVVNVVDLEDYVKGVLPSEMPGNWELEALKAQAVCARTFACLTTKHLSAYGFDVCSSTDCQAYSGIGEATSATDRAVEETEGECLYYDGELAQAYYHSSDGGATEDAENVWGTDVPYLRGKEDPYEAQISIPDYRWTVTYTWEELTWVLQNSGYDIGDVVDAYVSEVTDLGNVYSVTFVDSRGKTLVRTGDDARMAFYSTTLGKNVPSLRFTITGGTGGGICEVLLLNDRGDKVWECLVRPGRKLRKGTRLSFGNGELTAEIVEQLEEGGRLIRFDYEGIFLETLERLGKMPLPPYIKEELQDQERYQTVYSKVLGSAAAPTAGLHFTPELLEKIRAKGVKIGYVTLHVGLGTFRPVKEDTIEDHPMHSEYCTIPQETADLINETRANGGRCICVGTTSCRTLESWAAEDGHMEAKSGWTDIYIYPGYKFKVMDGLVTNFHLPESTLIMLVSAFAGREHVLAAYEEAVREKYRFFSFGDAMFIS